MFADECEVEVQQERAVKQDELAAAAGADSILVADVLHDARFASPIDVTTAPAIITVGSIVGGNRNNIIPDSVVGAFAKGDILQILLFSILFGFALMAMGERGRTLRSLIDDSAHAVFGVIAIVMKAAPIGAFGAMAYTIGKFGPSALTNLAGLIGLFYMTAALFIVVVLGLIAQIVGSVSASFASVSPNTFW